MSSKIKQRFLLLAVFVIAGFTSITLSNHQIPQVLAETPKLEAVEEAVNLAKSWEKQAKLFYSTNQFERAISLWQQANKAYADLGDILSRSRILSNIALGYSQLGDWDKAQENIITSLNLLNQDAAMTASDRYQTLAQVQNNQGILQLAQGKPEAAVASWEKAAANYRLAGDELGSIRAAINQASAFKNLGLYRRALKALTQVEASLTQQPNSPLKATGLRNYGDILRLVGDVNRARQVLEQSLLVSTELKSTQDRAKTLLALGNTLQTSKPEKAMELYQQGAKTCKADPSCANSGLPLQINLAQLNLLLETNDWQQGAALIPKIQSGLSNLPNNRLNINQQINFAHSLVKLSKKADKQGLKLDNTPSWSEIEQIVVAGITKAVNLKDRRAESYALGLRGQIQEELQQWNLALNYTQKALVIAQSINSPEISYLWQWQLGRISQAQQDRPQAIAHYSQAIELLKSLSQDLVAIDPDIQYSFRESVEPVYRGLVSLLLETDSASDEISQANLEGAREVIESLQLAELHNFFREACLDAQPVKIDSVDRHAAVIYPIILRDRLEVILSLPEQPLRHYSQAIPQKKLEQVIEQFHQSIVVRSRRQFYAPSQKLYNWLIRPALDDLAQNEIKTLVFVPDGAFRNIPMGALHSGKNYLIEDYGVALTPGLQLLAPKPLEQLKLKTIAAGLTEKRQGFSALNYVNSELTEIEQQLSSIVLLNEEFTSEALQKEIKFSDYPIVHIATHGQFSSSLEDTFVLAWDSRININELDNILQTRGNTQEQAIELLVLSACETATGDKWAALGLAGMSVRAGARSTLATLWSVNDSSTAKLMSEFYRELSDKPIGKAEAVRQAQLALLNSRWYKHPFYWAPYVLLGNWL